jgi:hypothetical protein
VRRGKEAYLADDLLQEAGDSLVMKLGEAANRLSRLGVLAPDGRDHSQSATATASFISTTRPTASSPGDALERTANVHIPSGALRNAEMALGHGD